jgi:ketosteroid isomerase-like protein
MVISSREALSVRLAHVYERFAGGDPAPMLDFLDEDVIYHLPGLHLGGGTLRGRRALFERLGRAAAACDAPPRIELLQVIAEGPLAVSLERFLARRNAESLDQPVCVVWRMLGSKCVEVWSHFADQPACDRFWSGVSF